MNFQEIVAADYQKNHRGRNYSAEQAQAILDKYIEKGNEYFSSGKTLFLIEKQNPDTLEFHSINGGNSADLVQGVTVLLQKINGKFDKAVTYYDNPVVNGLANKIPFPHTIRKIDQGLDRTYELTFDIRST